MLLVCHQAWQKKSTLHRYLSAPGPAPSRHSFNARTQLLQTHSLNKLHYSQVSWPLQVSFGHRSEKAYLLEQLFSVDSRLPLRAACVNTRRSPSAHHTHRPSPGPSDNWARRCLGDARREHTTYCRRKTCLSVKTCRGGTHGEDTVQRRHDHLQKNKIITNLQVARRWNIVPWRY